jgi:hypothetical protein
MPACSANLMVVYFCWPHVLGYSCVVSDLTADHKLHGRACHPIHLGLSSRYTILVLEDPILVRCCVLVDAICIELVLSFLCPSVCNCASLFECKAHTINGYAFTKLG